jgi:hypothetical protein
VADNDELEQLWRSPSTATVKASDLLAVALARTKRLDRATGARNLRECIGGAFVAIFFTYAALHSPNALSRAGNLIVAASGIWIIFCMLRFGRPAPSPASDMTAADFQKALLSKYDRQIALLKHVKYWYLLPPYAGLLLASAGVMIAQNAKGQPFWPQAIAAAAYTAVFGFIWWLNEHSAAGYLRRERAQLLDDMQSPAEDRF